MLDLPAYEKWMYTGPPVGGCIPSADGKGVLHMAETGFLSVKPRKGTEVMAGKTPRKNKPGLDVRGWRAVLDMTCASIHVTLRQNMAHFLSRLRDEAQPDTMLPHLTGKKMYIIFGWNVFDEAKWTANKTNIWCSKRLAEAVKLVSEECISLDVTPTWDSDIQFREVRIGDVFMVLCVWPDYATMKNLVGPDGEIHDEQDEQPPKVGSDAPV